MDWWDFKQYILWFLFYRYLSNTIVKFVNNNYHKNKISDYNPNYSFEECNDEDISEEAQETIKKSLGYYIKPSFLFNNVLKNIDNIMEDDNLSDFLLNWFLEIENNLYPLSKDDLFGLLTSIPLQDNKLWTSISLINQKIKTIIMEIGKIKISDDDGNDILGDAYEYLMHMYASNAGKSWGEFFTPQEVAELLTDIVTEDLKGKSVYECKVYDPACGSWWLLLRVKKHIKNKWIDIKPVFYWQELNPTTYNLARINMILHHIWYEKFDIKNADTLINPQHQELYWKMDIIVSNPPYSVKWNPEDNNIIDDPRYTPAGVYAPKWNGDFAFIMHSLYHLKDNGVAAIVCFPWIMYRKGAEATIREYLVKNGFVEAVIQLPENLFYWTTIATTILVLRKKQDFNKKTLFVDASRFFVREKQKNKLREEDKDKIVAVYKAKTEERFVSRLVGIEEIAKNNYNLAVSKYVEDINSQEENIDIEKVNQELENIAKRITILREKIDNTIKKI